MTAQPHGEAAKVKRRAYEARRFVGGCDEQASQTLAEDYRDPAYQGQDRPLISEEGQPALKRVDLPPKRGGRVLAALIFASGLALGAEAASYQPQILVLEFSDGAREEIAATSPETCAAAVRAIEGGLWLPVGMPVTRAFCQRGNRFETCGAYIAGFNAPAACGGAGGSR